MKGRRLLHEMDTPTGHCRKIPVSVRPTGRIPQGNDVKKLPREIEVRTPSVHRTSKPLALRMRHMCAMLGKLAGASQSLLQ